MPDKRRVTREQLIKGIRAWCRKNDVPFALNKQGGKGSHCKVTVGERWTIVQSGTLLPRHIDAVLRQLGIPKDAIRR